MATSWLPTTTVVSRAAHTACSCAASSAGSSVTVNSLRLSAAWMTKSDTSSVARSDATAACWRKAVVKELSKCEERPSAHARRATTSSGTPSGVAAVATADAVAGRS